MQIASKEINKNRKKFSKIKIIFLFIFIFTLGFFSNIAFSFNLNVEITQQPQEKTKDQPLASFKATVDEGYGVIGATYSLINKDTSNVAADGSCNTKSGFSFGSNEEEVEFTCGPSSVGSGRYEMEVEVTAREGGPGGPEETKTVTTNETIVDRINPEIIFYQIETSDDDGTITNIPDLNFEGEAIDTLTNITSIQYRYYEDMPKSDSTPADIYNSEEWEDCEPFTQSLNVNFVCDPDNVFADTADQDYEHRMYVMATDELDNIGLNFYRFQVDTVPPYDLSITYPNDSGIVFDAGQSYNIEWVEPKDDFELGSYPITIKYSSDGEFNDPEVLVEEHESSGPWLWSINQGEDATTQGRIKIIATDKAGNSIEEISEPFEIREHSAPSINIESLNEHDVASSSPVIISAIAEDDYGIYNPQYRYRESGGSWSSYSNCSFVSGGEGDSSVDLECQLTFDTDGSDDADYDIQIRANNDQGNTGSSVYTFTFDTIPPVINVGNLNEINKATRPGASVSDAGIGEDVSTYSWTQISGSGLVTFDSASDEDPLISANETDGYEVELYACDLAGNCDQEVLVFNWTNLPLNLEIISPIDGETLNAGTYYNVEWTDPGGNDLDSFSLHYSVDDEEYQEIASNLNKNNFQYNWLVPFQYSENVKIKVSADDSSNNSLLESDPVTFSIEPPNINVEYPVSSSIYKYGDPLEIQWTDPGVAALERYEITYSYNGGSWQEINNNVASNQTSYSWSVDNIHSQEVIIKVEAFDSSDSIISGESDQFTVDSEAPEVSIDDLGEISTAQYPNPDVFDSFDDISDLTFLWEVEVEESGGSLIISSSNIKNPTLSGTVSGDYTAELTVKDRAGNSSSDTVSFTWNGDPEDFTITKPVESDMFKGGSTIEINWEESVGADYYEIKYRPNDGIDWETIVVLENITEFKYFWESEKEDSDEVQIKIIATDQYGNKNDSKSDLFLIDSTPPEVNAGYFVDSTIRSPTIPIGLDSSDEGSGIDTHQWEGEGLIFSEPNELETTINATATGFYQATLTVTDKVGNSASDSIFFLFLEAPPKPDILSPGSDSFWRGGRNKTIEWEIEDPGNLDRFIIDYSIDGGNIWEDIETINDVSTRSINWLTPSDLNSTSSKIRIVVYNDNDASATSTRQFTFDSEAPTIEVSDLGTIEVETNVEAEVTDNIDSQSDMEYFWDVVNVPESQVATGTVIFKESHTDMSPSVEATVSGEYKIQIRVNDRAGNISNDYLTFNWDGDPEIPIIKNPDSYTYTQGGENLNIEWEVEGSNLEYFNLYYSLDNGQTWDEIEKGIDSGLREFDWLIPEGINSTSSQIMIDVYDEYGNKNSNNSANFTIDSTPPSVDAGYIESPISEPTATSDLVIEDNFTPVEELSVLWTELSTPYPQATLNISNATSTDSLFSGDMTGEYELLLSVTDNSGNVGTSTLSFYWLSPFDPEIYQPEEGEFVKGNDNYQIKWNLLDPGDLSHLELEYSTDGGIIWDLIDSNIASSSLSYDWEIPEINSTSSIVRLITVNNNNIKATSTTDIFTIDSEAPVVNAGSFSSNVNQATKPGASASDNIDSLDDLTYSWSKVSGPGSISFGGSSILNPTIEASQNGDYVAKLTVTDRAGNSSSDTVSFTRRITSSGGGGGGGIRYCSEVTYSDWGPCINNLEHRSIVSTVPSICTPTSAQRDLQTRECGDDVVDPDKVKCEELELGGWGPCIDNWQVREIINRYPENCQLTFEQLEEIGQYCYSDDYDHVGCFDLNSAQIVQEARDLYIERDPTIINNLSGRILLQVEEGRVWYLNPRDNRKYYLGSPRNAFCVMSLVSEGITNEDLDRLPIGVLDGSLVLDKDSDGDGLPDRLEIALGTDPHNPDTDGDGYCDYTEVIHGYDPLGPGRMPIDKNFLMRNLGNLFLQVKNHGEAWYIEPVNKRRYYLGRPEEAFGIIKEFGIAISNEDLNKIPVGRFNERQMLISETLLR